MAQVPGALARSARDHLNAIGRLWSKPQSPSTGAVTGVSTRGPVSGRRGLRPRPSTVVNGFQPGLSRYAMVGLGVLLVEWVAIAAKPQSPCEFMVSHCGPCRHRKLFSHEGNPCSNSQLDLDPLLDINHAAKNAQLVQQG